MATAPHVLIIRDGWGHNPHPEHDAFNAIKLAHTPIDDQLMADWPSTLIATSGEDVGLSEGTMGNSEVGHLNIGAGRIVDQEALRITRVCREGKLGAIEALTNAIHASRRAGSSLHLMGIASDAGVHGQLAHLYALLEVARECGHQKVFVHLFTDGRDTGPFTGRGFVEQVEAKCHELGVGRVVSIVGRYWAMDRDNRWERVQAAYDLLTGRSEVPVFESAGAAVQEHYDQPPAGMKGDEFVGPRAVGEDWRQTRIASGDAVVFYNYRTDRPRELCSAFLLPEFTGVETVPPSPDSGKRGFDRGPRLDLHFVMMTPYSKLLAEFAAVVFPPPAPMKDIAGSWISSLGLTQFRCAETEKAPHVTFFFNDQRDEAFEGERREIIQSPKVATYDLKPEMSAAGVRDAVLARLDAADCEPFIVVNFANGDMVGHTGDLAAAIKACEVVDACVGAIVSRVLEAGGSAIVTADHGNAEQMRDPTTNMPHTAHTTYTVPLIVVGEAFRGRSLRSGGRLGDIVPTSLEMMGLAQPEAMTGQSLLLPAP